MKKPEIILVGGGGHCKACIDVIELENKFQIKGIIDLPELLGQKVLGYSIIGSDADLPKLAKNNYAFLITLGFFGKSKIRETLYNIIKTAGSFHRKTSLKQKARSQYPPPQVL